MALLIQIDGVSYRDPAEARISIFDHGFLFGDSIYEVVRTHGGRPYEVTPHLERLFRSAERVALDVGKTATVIEAEIEAAVRASGCEGEAYVRIMVTRGMGELHIDPSSCTTPTWIYVVKDLPTWPTSIYSDGIALGLVSTIRNTRGSVDPGIKTGNYLNSVLAYIEARKAGAQEALMANVHGQLTECTTSNLFFVVGGELHTPSLQCGILSGITRSDVLRLAATDGLPCREGQFTVDDLRAADEAFITSTTRGIMPVATLDGAPIGTRERPVTSRLQALLATEVAAFLAEQPG